MTNLQKYSDKLLEIELFKTNNSKIFDKLEELDSELSKLEGELKIEAKENGDMENDIVKVTVVERWNKSYNYDRFLDLAKPEEQEALKKAKGIDIKIKKDVFDELIKQHLITEESKQMCFMEELSSTAVIIKSKIN